MGALLACAPARLDAEDGCSDVSGEAPALASTWCQWPAAVPLPAPAPAVAREGSYAPGTLVMPGHPDVLDHGPRDVLRIALTFDACSSSNADKYDERITRTLEELRVPATIFVGGSWARDEAAKVKALGKNPLFELGNHSYSHPHLTWKTNDRIREELVRTQEEIAGLTGSKPSLFRPPFGEYDDRVVQIARELGLRTVEYDLPSGDPGAPRDKLVAWVLEKAQPGSIVVMHLNHVRFHTADALPDIISGLRARGFTFVKVSDLASGLPRLPEQKLADAGDDKSRQAANLLVPVTRVEPLRASIEVGH